MSPIARWLRKGGEHGQPCSRLVRPTIWLPFDGHFGFGMRPEIAVRETGRRYGADHLARVDTPSSPKQTSMPAISWRAMPKRSICRRAPRCGRFPKKPTIWASPIFGTNNIFAASKSREPSFWFMPGMHAHSPRMVSWRPTSRPRRSPQGSKKLKLSKQCDAAWASTHSMTATGS